LENCVELGVLKNSFTKILFTLLSIKSSYKISTTHPLDPVETEVVPVKLSYEEYFEDKSKNDPSQLKTIVEMLIMVDYTMSTVIKFKSDILKATFLNLTDKYHFDRFIQQNFFMSKVTADNLDIQKILSWYQTRQNISFDKLNGIRFTRNSIYLFSRLATSGLVEVYSDTSDKCLINSFLDLSIPSNLLLEEWDEIFNAIIMYV
jgi:hypothetical protein